MKEFERNANYLEGVVAEACEDLGISDVDPKEITEKVFGFTKWNIFKSTSLVKRSQMGIERCESYELMSPSEMRFSEGDPVLVFLNTNWSGLREERNPMIVWLAKVTDPGENILGIEYIPIASVPFEATSVIIAKSSEPQASTLSKFKPAILPLVESD